MSEVRTYRRKVLSRQGSRAGAEACAKELSAQNPDSEYAVEYTPVVNAREQWRVIHVSEVPLGTPDKHPSCEYVRDMQRDMIHDMIHEAWSDGDDRGWM